MVQVNMRDLELKIGHEPRQGDPNWVFENLVVDPEKRKLLIAWMILNGIPQKSANAAIPMSLAKAYSINAYLATWRKNANPSFAALHEADFDAEDEPESTFDASQHREQAAPVELAAGTAEKLASSVAPLIKRLVTGEVEDQLKGRKLELSDDAKQKIRDIARDSGLDHQAAFHSRITAEVKAELDRRIPPQEIVIRNAVTGNAVNIGVQHMQFARLLRTCQIRNHQGHRPNIWLTGPTGSGKTTAAENVAKALGLDFGADSSLDADYKVYGFFNAQGQYIRTTFRNIFENGGVYVADEIDNWSQGALVGLNAPLANGFGSFPDGMVKRHPDCIVIACANTWGLGATNDYVGRNKLDAASLDRFQPKMDWPIDPKLEMSIAVQMADGYGQVWCELVQGARAAAKRQGLKIIISPRATINGIALLQAGFEADEVVDMTFAAGLAKDQANAINDADARYKVTRAVRHSAEAVAEETSLRTWDDTDPDGDDDNGGPSRLLDPSDLDTEATYVQA